MQTHWDQVHPEQMYRRHEGEWCGWYAWGVDVMHRGLDKLKQCSCVDAEVQHGQVQAPVSIKAGVGGERLQRTLQKRTWGTCGWKAGHELTSMHLQPESHLCSGPGEVWPADPGAVYVPLLHFCENPPGVLHLALGPSAERCGPIEAGPAEGHRKDQMDWTSPMMKGWES